ncbi:hypothetical protein ACJMK2_005760 [Sinanodonta woodiana]|uniref:Mitochondrial proton/calcium exchanger protein n=1 Tax=Sinanodonta woodiana TaxID=1069815 RepID=A0ABD3VR33_SINWO
MAHKYISCFIRHGINNDPLKKVVHCRYKSTQTYRYRGKDAGITVQRLVHSTGYLPRRCLYAVSSIQDDNWKKSTFHHQSKSLQRYCNRTIPIGHSGHPQWLLMCSYHTTRSIWKEESTVEKSVKILKQELTEKGGEKEAAPAVASVVSPSADIKKEALMKRIWLKIKSEAKHYYNGFKLLFIELKVAIRLVWEVMNGKNLTRREYRQLVRTAGDVFRMIPFLVFIIVPFMEFLLPVALKLFPNMLPSTFKEEKTEQEKLKKTLKMKLEMAKVLQDMIKSSAMQSATKSSTKVEEFSEFLQKVRSTGVPVTTSEILKYSKLFEDDITLDSLNRSSLQALCRVLSLPTIPPDNILRFQLRMKLRQLKTDDKMISKEGVDSLMVWELQTACRARGMRSLGLSEDRLKFQLQQWLDLHLKEDIPVSLLLLSRAFYLPENLSTTEQLKATISALPEQTSEEAKIKIAEVTGEKVDTKAKLELIKQQEEAIKKDKEAEALAAAAKAKTQRDAAEALAAQSAMEADLKKELDYLHDPASIIEANPNEEFKKEEKLVTEEEITSKDLEEIESALEEIAEQKSLNIEMEELSELKEEVNEYQEDLQNLKSLITASGGTQNDIRESKAAARISKRVDRLINQSVKIIDELHEQRETIQEQIDLSEVKMRRSSELKDDAQKRQELLEKIKQQKGNMISLNEMVLALKRLQKVPDDTRLQKIVQVLDEDKDGNIDISHTLKVIELLGRENIKLSASQMTDIIDLLKRETLIEEEEKKKEKVEKEQISNSQAENNKKDLKESQSQ